MPLPPTRFRTDWSTAKIRAFLERNKFFLQFLFEKSMMNELTLNPVGLNDKIILLFFRSE